MLGFFDAAEQLLQRRHLTDSLERGLAIYHPLTAIVATLPTGQSVNNVNAGAVSAETYLGVPCLRFTNGSGNTYVTVPFSGNERNVGWKGAMSMWIAKDGLSERWKNKPLFTMPRAFNANASLRLCLGKRNDGDLVAYAYNADGTQTSLLLMDSAQATGFHHVAMNITIDSGTHVARTADVYLDGAYAGSISSRQHTNNAFQYVQAGMYSADSDESDPGSVLLSGLRVWNRQLTNVEMALLAREFSPTAP